MKLLQNFEPEVDIVVVKIDCIEDVSLIENIIILSVIILDGDMKSLSVVDDIILYLMSHGYMIIEFGSNKFKKSVIEVY
jgi:hypothetical protein